jgi:hypothetical protein
MLHTASPYHRGRYRQGFESGKLLACDPPEEAAIQLLAQLRPRYEAGRSEPKWRVLRKKLPLNALQGHDRKVPDPVLHYD